MQQRGIRVLPPIDVVVAGHVLEAVDILDLGC